MYINISLLFRAFNNNPNQGGGGNKRDQIWEEKRKQRVQFNNQQNPQFQQQSTFLNIPQPNHGRAVPKKSSFNASLNSSIERSSITSSPGKKKKKVMFLLPGEEKVAYREGKMLKSALKSDASEEDFFKASAKYQPQNDGQERVTFDEGNSQQPLTMNNIKVLNDENSEKENYMRRYGSQPQMPTYQEQIFQNIDQGSIGNDSISSDNQNTLPRFSPIKRKDPNNKFIPTSQFVVGEGGLARDPNNMNYMTEKATKEKEYQRELLEQMDEKQRKKQEEKDRLKEIERLEEERVKRELLELEQQQAQEKENKKQKLGDIMERYQQEQTQKREQLLQDLEGHKQEFVQAQQREVPINVPMPPGAKYALYENPDPSKDESQYDYKKDFEKFDILDRGRRAAVSGVPKSKLLADIGHDLKMSLRNEINKAREAINLQQRDFQDQLSRLKVQATHSIQERDKVCNHLKMLRKQVEQKRNVQMAEEKNLHTVLDKYKLERQYVHYPSRPYHLEYKLEKPEEKKSVYEKIFFDNISNKIEAEKLNPNLEQYRQATQNPHNLLTTGQGHYFKNSKGHLNSESTLVTLDNKQLYPSKSLYHLPDLQSKTKIVNWHREPYEYYNSRVKDIHPRHEMYIVKNNYDDKMANKIEDPLNFKRFTVPEREEHKPQYNSRIKPIDLACINIEKLNQVNENRLTQLDREYMTPQVMSRPQPLKRKNSNDDDFLNGLMSLKMQI